MQANSIHAARFSARHRRGWRCGHWGVTIALIALLCHRASAADAAPAAETSGAPAPANDSGGALAPPMFSFAGFGTAGVVHSSNDKADFTASYVEASGAGFSHRWSVGVDSLLGGQLTLTVNPRLAAVVQVVAEQNANDQFSPHVEWLNVKYQFTPDFSVRVGRTALPVFMLTDSRKVGFANPWVRPPVEVYDLVPVTSNDGLDMSYHSLLAGAINTVQFAAGRSNPSYPRADGVGSVSSRQQALMVDSLEYSSFTLRLNYGRARITLPGLTPLFNGFAQFGAAGDAVVEQYAVSNRLVEFRDVGLSYDPGSWFAMGEWGRLDTGSVLGDRSGGYLSAGYRTFANVSSSSSRSVNGLNPVGLPPALAAAAGGLNSALDAIRGEIPAQDTISLGARWEVVKDVDLKLQLDHSRLGAGSSGELTNLQPGFRFGSTVNVFTATVDFLF